MLPLNELLQEGRYRVTRHIGQNETGSIYEGVDNILEKKIFINHFTYNGRKNIADEEKFLKNIKHEAFLRVTDYFAEVNGWFVVMEAQDGEFLSDILHGGKTRFEFSDVLKWTEHILDGFAYLHLNLPPVIYGDLKPHNMFLNSAGQIKLLASAVLKNRISFAGLGKLSEAALSYSPLEQIFNNLDAASQKVITDSYDETAEKILRQPIDARSDIYSLGVLMYQMLSGELPKNALERSIEILEGSTDPIVSPDMINDEVAPEIAQIIMRSLAIRRENRLDSAVIMRQILRTAFVRIKERESAMPEPAAIETPAPSVSAASGNYDFSDFYDNEDVKTVKSKVAEPENVPAIAENAAEDVQASTGLFEIVEPQTEIVAENKTVPKREKPPADFFDFDESDEEEILGIKPTAPIVKESKPVKPSKPVEPVKSTEIPVIQKEAERSPKVEKTEEIVEMPASAAENSKVISVSEAEKVVPEIIHSDYRRDDAPADFGNLFEDAELNRRSKFGLPAIVLVLFLIGGAAVGAWYFATQKTSDIAVQPEAKATTDSASNPPAEAPQPTEIQTPAPANTETAETQTVTETNAANAETAATETDAANPVLEQKTVPTAKKQTPVKPNPAPAKPQTASVKPAEKQPKKMTVDDLINGN